MRDAPIEVIRASYRALSQKYHPDRNVEPDAERRMKIINEAWRVLSDPLLRGEHDARISKAELGEEVRPGKDKSKAEGAPPSSQGGQTGRLQKLDQLLGRHTNTLYFLVACTIVGFAIGSQYFGATKERVIDAAPSVAALTPARNGAEISFGQPRNSTSNAAPGRDDGVGLGPRPAHGYVENVEQIYEDGHSTFAIDNTQGEADAEVKLYRDEKLMRSMVIHTGRKFVARQLPAGTYEMKYKITQYGKVYVFKAQRNFEISEETTEGPGGTETRFSKIRVTLTKVLNGNLATEQIPSGEV